MGRDNFPRKEKRTAKWDGSRDFKRKGEKFWREKRRAAKMAQRGY